MYDYAPFYLQLLKAVCRTFEIHLGLWLATVEISRRWRFPAAILFLVSGTAVYLLFWNYNLFTLLTAIFVLGVWLFKILRGKKFAN